MRESRSKLKFIKLILKLARRANVFQPWADARKAVIGAKCYGHKADVQA